VSEPAAKRLSLTEMARLLQDRFITGCTSMDGVHAGETWLLVEADQLDGLKQIVAALESMAPHADGIKKLIKGSRR